MTYECMPVPGLPIPFSVFDPQAVTVRPVDQVACNELVEFTGKFRTCYVLSHFLSLTGIYMSWIMYCAHRLSLFDVDYMICFSSFYITFAFCCCVFCTVPLLLPLERCWKNSVLGLFVYACMRAWLYTANYTICFKMLVARENFTKFITSLQLGTKMNWLDMRS